MIPTSDQKGNAETDATAGRLRAAQGDPQFLFLTLWNYFVGMLKRIHPTGCRQVRRVYINF